MWHRVRDWLHRAGLEVAAAGRDVAASLRDLSRACTCGNPHRTGPCPRHGTPS